jgi:hypothetical protein
VEELKTRNYQLQDQVTQYCIVLNENSEKSKCIVLNQSWVFPILIVCIGSVHHIHIIPMLFVTVVFIRQKQNLKRIYTPINPNIHTHLKSITSLNYHSLNIFNNIDFQ